MRLQHAQTGRFVASTLAEHFAAHVERIPFHGCWEWAGTIFPSGYGNVMFDGKNRRAHRVSYELHYGPIPPTLHVCHRCDNRSCVNPDHLFLGTALDNERDKYAKGRQGNIGRTATKIPHSAIGDMLAMRAAGASYGAIARKYGTSRGAVRERLIRQARLPRLEG